MLKNTTENYGWLAKAFHWVIGLMIIAMCVVGDRMVAMPDGDAKWSWYGLHKALGLIVLALVLGRTVWRFMNVNPTLGDNVPQWQVWLAKLTVGGLYVVMLGMPISGIIMSLYGGYPISFFGLFEIPAAVKNEAVSHAAALFHNAGLWYVGILLAAHIGGALYHHFVLKDNVLKRILITVEKNG